MHLSLLAAFALLSSTAPAAPESHHTAHPATEAKADDASAKDPNQRICKRWSGGATGSRLGKSAKVCKTRAEWTEERKVLKRRSSRATFNAGDATAPAAD